MINDFILFWPNKRGTYPRLWLDEDNLSIWSETGEKVSTALVHDNFLKSAEMVEDFADLSGGYFLSKDAYDVLKGFRINMEDEAEKVVVKVGSSVKEGYYLDIGYGGHIINKEKTKFEGRKKIISPVYDEQVLKSLFENYDISRPNGLGLYLPLVITKSVFESIKAAGLKGYIWLEPKDYKSQKIIDIIDA